MSKILKMVIKEAIEEALGWDDSITQEKIDQIAEKHRKSFIKKFSDYIKRNHFSYQL